MNGGYPEMEKRVKPTALIAKWQLDMIFGKHGPIVREKSLQSFEDSGQFSRRLLSKACRVLRLYLQ